MQIKKDLSVIVGLGKTGLSCIRYLTKLGHHVAVTDTRSNPPELEKLRTQFPQVRTELGALNEKLLLNATQIIMSPGVSLKEPVLVAAAKRRIPIIGDIEIFANRVNVPIVAITGTNGKSTVTALVGEMARVANRRVMVAGNIGTPVLDLLDEVEPELYVLELSSFQLETTYSLLPRAATILNITPDHLDRYPGGFADYVAAKQRIYRNCGVVVWNRDDEYTRPSVTGETITFGMSEPTSGMFGLRQVHGVIHLAYGEENLLPVNAMRLRGQHNWLNALAALALGHAIELPIPPMLEVLHTFSGLPHRCQLIRELEGVTWYNDSKATNTGASCASIVGLSRQIKGKIILIAGGQGKGSDFLDLRESISDRVRHVIVIGEAAQQIRDVIADLVKVTVATNMTDAVKIAQTHAHVGDAVLLAPACASFDMFRDFNHRGEVFTQLVDAL